MRKFLFTAIFIFSTIIISSANASECAYMVRGHELDYYCANMTKDNNGNFSFNRYGTNYSGYIKDGQYYITNASQYGTFHYNDDGLMDQFGYNNSTYKEYYEYNGKNVIKTTTAGNKTILTYENNITSLGDMTGTFLERDINADGTDSNRAIRTSKQIATAMINYDGSGNKLYIQFDGSTSYHYDENGKIASAYGGYEHLDSGMTEIRYVYNYDENGKLINKIENRETWNWETGENTNSSTTTETYKYTGNKFQVCDANGQNCSEKLYSNMEEYILEPYAGRNFSDLLDDDFGMVGYVPSRLKQSASGESGLAGNGSYSCNNYCSYSEAIEATQKNGKYTVSITW